MALIFSNDYKSFFSICQEMLASSELEFTFLSIFKKFEDFDVSIRPRTSPFRQSTELRLRDDGREKMPSAHQVTEL
jgi:hypothetical protein